MGQAAAILKMMIICASLLLIKINTTLAFEIPECHTAQEMLCEKLRTADGFTYTLPPMNHLPSECEHGWYYPNGTFIKDSTGGVTPENLTLSICEDVEWHNVCPTKPFNCSLIKFAVLKNSTAMELQANNNDQEDKKDDDNEDHSQNKGLSDVEIFTVIGILVVAVFVLSIIIWKCWPRCKGRNEVV